MPSRYFRKEKKFVVLKKEVDRTKRMLIKRAIVRGELWENFGQRNIRELRDMNRNLFDNSFTEFGRKGDKLIDKLDDWASSFDDNDLKKEKKKLKRVM